MFHKADDVLRYNSPLRIDNVMLKGGVMPGACVYLDLPAGDYKLHSMSETDVTLTLAAGDTKQVVLEGVTEEIGGGYLDRSTPKLADGLDTSACTGHRFKRRSVAERRRFGNRQTLTGGPQAAVIRATAKQFGTSAFFA